MKYVHTKTGAVIETACAIKGGNWVEVEENQPKESTSSPVKKVVAKKTTGKKSGET